MFELSSVSTSRWHGVEGTLLSGRAYFFPRRVFVLQRTIDVLLHPSDIAARPDNASTAQYASLRRTVVSCHVPGSQVQRRLTVNNTTAHDVFWVLIRHSSPWSPKACVECHGSRRSFCCSNWRARFKISWVSVRLVRHDRSMPDPRCYYS